MDNFGVKPNPTLDDLIKRAAEHQMGPEERRLQKLSFVRGMTGATDEQIIATCPDLGPRPHCAAKDAELRNLSRQASMAIDDCAEAADEIERLRTALGTIVSLLEGQRNAVGVSLTAIARAALGPNQ
jgi:hypothetical protein